MREIIDKNHCCSAVARPRTRKLSAKQPARVRRRQRLPPRRDSASVAPPLNRQPPITIHCARAQAPPIGPSPAAMAAAPHVLARQSAATGSLLIGRWWFEAPPPGTARGYDALHQTLSMLCRWELAFSISNSFLFGSFILSLFIFYLLFIFFDFFFSGGFFFFYFFFRWCCASSV